MTLVRQRRQKQALSLSLPTSGPESSFQRRAYYLPPPPPSLPISPGSPDIESLSDLEKSAVLGHGNGGTVYKVRHKRTASVFALKVLRFDHNNAAVIRQQASREAEILKLVDSPYIVRCYAAFSNEDDLCFAMEHMERGSLHDVLRQGNVLNEDIISGITLRVLKGLRYLHKRQIVHGDIKPSNLLINSNWDVKIADFGVSRVVVGENDAYDTYMGTCAYMSPERFDPQRWGGDDSDGFEGDVWSLGVVVLECLVGHYPLIRCGEKPDWAALICAICFGERLEMPDHSSPEFRDFVRRCLDKNWRTRGTVEELLDHPFVNKSRCRSYCS